MGQFSSDTGQWSPCCHASSEGGEEEALIIGHDQDQDHDDGGGDDDAAADDDDDYYDYDYDNLEKKEQQEGKRGGKRESYMSSQRCPSSLRAAHLPVKREIAAMSEIAGSENDTHSVNPSGLRWSIVFSLHILFTS